MSDIQSLLPSSGAVLTELEVSTQPSLTYAMDIGNGSIHGLTEDQEAMRQAIYKILRTERYVYPAYTWSYGIELDDLFGRPTPYVETELRRRIKEALECDDRIDKVDSFAFSYPRNKNSIHVEFTAHTIYGEVQSAYDYGQEA